MLAEKPPQSLLSLLISIIAYLTLAQADKIMHIGQPESLVISILFVLLIINLAFQLSFQVEYVAERLKEPYGTMILTISAVVIEVVIIVMMLSHTSSTTLARDAIYSAVMLDINGILGLCAIVGGIKYGEVEYNVNSGNTYIVMIMTALGISMALPAFLPQEHWRLYSMFTIVTMSVFYALFLKMQTGRHRNYFSYRDQHQSHTSAGMPKAISANVKFSILYILAGIITIGFLSEEMSKHMDAGLTGSGVPPIVAAIVVAIIAASPEVLTALKAAVNDRMQTVVNIALGATLSTVILTVPVIEAIALIEDRPLIVGLSPTQMVMTFLTLIVATINLHDGETNAIEGMTHFVLFMAFAMLAALGM
ncbi:MULTISPECIES: calcium:proton antiporter [Methylophilus]|jgi:Ca2+:H+ antiporter|uniref:calcium:proton antiporter n=1 Tax=Methylophilus TaxID=16 RepID=UPI000D435457|nr:MULTISPECIES: calcium:proton antiporter [Methylophilus]PPD12740.1 MAG: calcium:proton antiporter [Methylophilus sp.]